MLTSLNRMTGLPVIWREKQIGCVEKALADMEHMQLNGLLIRKGIGSAKWAPRESIRMAGRQCVVLDKLPLRVKPPEMPAVRRAVLQTGQSAGMVCDVILHEKSLRIAALEVSQGPLYRLLGRCGYAMDCRQHAPDEVIVPQLLTWTQLIRQLGEEDEA